MFGADIEKEAAEIAMEKENKSLKIQLTMKENEARTLETEKKALQKKIWELEAAANALDIMYSKLIDKIVYR